MGISLRFGDEYLDELMPFVRALHDPAQLECIKDALKRVNDISELKSFIINTN